MINIKIFFYVELSKYLERKEELELRKAKQQHKEYIQSLGASKSNICSTERKKKLGFPEKGNEIKLSYKIYFLYIV